MGSFNDKNNERNNEENFFLFDHEEKQEEEKKDDSFFTPNHEEKKEDDNFFLLNHEEDHKEEIKEDSLVIEQNEDNSSFISSDDELYSWLSESVNKNEAQFVSGQGDEEPTIILDDEEEKQKEETKKEARHTGGFDDVPPVIIEKKKDANKSGFDDVKPEIIEKKEARHTGGFDDVPPIIIEKKEDASISELDDVEPEKIEEKDQEKENSYWTEYYNREMKNARTDEEVMQIAAEKDFKAYTPKPEDEEEEQPEDEKEEQPEDEEEEQPEEQKEEQLEDEKEEQPEDKKEEQKEVQKEEQKEENKEENKEVQKEVANKPLYRIVKKKIESEKEFGTEIDLSEYGVNDVNDTNQLRTFVQNNANNKENPFFVRSVEYTRYRISALQEIDKRSQELTNPKTGKLSKVIFAGKEVDKVEGHPDVTDCFIMDNINQEEKQTSANGCWSVSMSLLLQSRGVDIDQQMIRAFKPTGDVKYYGDRPMAVEDYMHLIEKVSPNTGLRSRMITSKENFAHLSNIDKASDEYRNGVAHVADNFKNVVNESLRRSNSPVSITDNNHFLTVVGTGKKDGKDGFFYKDSLGAEEPNKTYFKTYEDYINEKLANPIPENALKSIQCTFLQDYEITQDKTSGVKTCEPVEGFPGLKFEDGKIKPSGVGPAEVREGDEKYLITEPAESGAAKDNTIATVSDGDMVETIYFPSKIMEGSPYLSIEAAQQEQAVENEFEKPATSALFRSATYSDYMNSVSRQLESEPLYKRASLPVDFELEDKFNKLSYGNALNSAMSHLRELNNNHANLKRLLSNNEPSQKAEEVADNGLTKAIKAAADSINLFLENTTESKKSEFYTMMEGLYNKLNGLAIEKAAVDAELEMYKNAYVHEHDVTLTNDLDKDLEVARLNVANLDIVLQDAEAELEKARQEYIKAVEAEEAAEKQEKTEESAENQEKTEENLERTVEDETNSERTTENAAIDQEKEETGPAKDAESTISNLEKDVEKENERLDKAIEDSANALHEYYKSLDAIEARLGLPLRSRSAFIDDGQDIGTLAVTNPFPSELSDDEKEKLGIDGADLNNKIKQEFDTLVKLQSEKENLNKNQNLEDVNDLINDVKNEDDLQNESQPEQKVSEDIENVNAIKGNATGEKTANEGSGLAEQVKESQAAINYAKNAASRSALNNYNRQLAKVEALTKDFEEAEKHFNTLLATKEVADLKKKAISKRNDAIVNTSSGLLSLSQGLERVDRKFPFFKVGRNKNSEEFQNLHDKIWEIQNKLTPNLSSEEKNNREVDKDYVLGNEFRSELQDLKESAQKYVAHIESLNAEKGKEGPSSDVGKQRLALANNVISFCDQMSQSFEKRDSLEKQSEKDITRNAERNLQPYNLKNDFSNDVVENQKRARDEKAQKEGKEPKKKSLFEILMELFGFKKSHDELQNEKVPNEKAQAQKEQAKEAQPQKELVKEVAKAEAQNMKDNLEKEEVKEENKEEVKEENKEEVKEENKEEVKEENKEEVKEENKEEINAGQNNQEVNNELDNEEQKGKNEQAREQDLDKKPKKTNEQVDAELKELEKNEGIDNQEEDLDEGKLDESKNRQDKTEADYDAELNELEDDVKKNPVKNNYFDNMIDRQKGHDERTNQFLNQAKANIANLNREIDKNQAEIQANPVLQGANVENANIPNNNIEVDNQQNNNVEVGNQQRERAVDNGAVVNSKQSANVNAQPKKIQSNIGSAAIEHNENPGEFKQKKSFQELFNKKNKSEKKVIDDSWEVVTKTSFNKLVQEDIEKSGKRIKEAKNRYENKRKQIKKDMNRFDQMSPNANKQDNNKGKGHNF